MSRPPLGPILCATFTAPDVAASARDYVTHLDQIVVEEGPLPADMAASWAAPAMAGRPSVLLRPRSAEPGWFRIVQGPAAPKPAFSAFGWLAMEILVKSTDAVSARLKGTPFREFEPPHDLGVVKGVRAMQAVGRAGEVLYLTERDEIRRFRYRFAMGEVDRLFIMVLGARDFDASKAFYERHFDVPVGIAAESAQTYKLAQMGLPAGRKYRLVTFLLAGGQEVVGKIQHDDHPAQARPNVAAPGELPPGIAVVTFEVPSLDGITLPFLAPPRVIEAPPYDGRRVATCIGPSGEMIELAARR